MFNQSGRRDVRLVCKIFSQNYHSIKIGRGNLSIAFIQLATYNYSETMREKRHIGRSQRQGYQQVEENAGGGSWAMNRILILHHSTFFAG